MKKKKKFQSTHSLRSATSGSLAGGIRQRFQSTHSLRSATVTSCCCSAGGAVSIHALLAECDLYHGHLPHRRNGFNPRTPCGVRLAISNSAMSSEMFQSTHSLRSATRKLQRLPYRIYRFNPRTPCGVRRAAWRMWTGTSRFQSTHSLRSATRLNQQSLNHESVSIHALLAECDSEDNAGTKRTIRFNPRTPCGVRLSMLRSGDWAFIVSIHALLAECDTITGFFLKRLRSFNPRTPCGVRLKADEKESILWAVFQSTHSLRSATKEHETSSTTRKVSIHALLAECDGLPQL